MAPEQDGASRHLQAIVDMGSNGIRFTITNLNPRLARTLIPVYHHRSPISLHDAQYVATSTERQAISSSTVGAVSAALLSFKETCSSFGVPDPQNITVVATEATRTAPNAGELLTAIKSTTDWDVQLLSKEDEARFGALGVAASVPECNGLVMDLGGGSVQLSYVTTHDDGRLPTIREGVVSLPYGAAALMRRLTGGGESKDDVLKEVQSELAKAISGFHLPEGLGGSTGGPLFVAGGGFRGWGYIAMAVDRRHPIQAINGYSMSWERFVNVERILDTVRRSQEDPQYIGEIVNEHSGTPPSAKMKKKDKKKQPGTDIHGVSGRRLDQLPAITLIVQALSYLLPEAKLRIGPVTFCAGGVPVGILYSRLDDVQRKQSALTVAAAACASTTIASLKHDPGTLRRALNCAVGPFMDNESCSVPPVIMKVIPALTELVNTHSALSDSVRASAALHYPLTGALQIVASLGISHAERAGFALALCARWGGIQKLPAEDVELVQRLRDHVGAAVSWWAEAVGRLSTLVLMEGAGVEVVGAAIDWDDVKACRIWDLRLQVSSASPVVDEEQDSTDSDVGSTHRATKHDHIPQDLRKAIKSLEKLGKKRNRITTAATSTDTHQDAEKYVKDDARESYGIHIRIAVESRDG